jgi:hypothetical protein
MVWRCEVNNCVCDGVVVGISRLTAEVTSLTAKAQQLGDEKARALEEARTLSPDLDAAKQELRSLQQVGVGWREEEDGWTGPLWHEGGSWEMVMMEGIRLYGGDGDDEDDDSNILPILMTTRGLTDQQEVRRLETEKRDLVFDGQQRLAHAAAVNDELAALRAKLDRVRGREGDGQTVTGTERQSHIL